MTRAIAWRGGGQVVLVAMAVTLVGCPPTAPQPAHGQAQRLEVLSPAEAARLIEQREDLFILNVCHKWEFDYYRIPGSALIPNTLLREHLPGNTLYPAINRGRSPEKGQPVLLYCSTGGRTKEAAEILAEMGYREVYVLGGGMRDWMQAGIPYEKTVLQGGEETSLE